MEKHSFPDSINEHAEVANKAINNLALLATGARTSAASAASEARRYKELACALSERVGKCQKILDESGLLPDDPDGFLSDRLQKLVDLAKLKQDAATAEALATVAKTSAASSTPIILNLRAENERVRAQNRKLQGDTAKQNKKLTAASAREAEVREALNEADPATEGLVLPLRIAELKRKLDDAQRKLGEAQQSASQTKDWSDLKGENNDLRHRLSRLHVEIMELRRSNRELQARNSKLQAEHAKLLKTVTRLRKSASKTAETLRGFVAAYHRKPAHTLPGLAAQAVDLSASLLVRPDPAT